MKNKTKTKKYSPFGKRNIPCLFQSYCLKVKEMDDEEYSYAALQEPLYRVETGNYEYRYRLLYSDFEKVDRLWGGILFLFYLSIHSIITLFGRSCNWWRMYAKVLKIHTWDHYGKFTGPFVFLFENLEPPYSCRFGTPFSEKKQQKNSVEDVQEEPQS